MRETKRIQVNRVAGIDSIYEFEASTTIKIELLNSAICVDVSGISIFSLSRFVGCQVTFDYLKDQFKFGLFGFYEFF